MRNWNVQVTDNLSINVRSDKKDPAKKTAKAIKDLINIQGFKLEKTGIYGKTHGPDEEREILYIIIGERQRIPDPALYKSDLDQFLSSIPDPIYDHEQVIAHATHLLRKHVRVDDKRQTQQQSDDEDQRMKEIERELADRDRKEEESFVSEWCLPEKIHVPDGMMAICLQRTFDNSHALSDYSCPHHSIGLPMLLAVSHRQPQTHNLARSAMNGCPGLAKLSWQWFTEKYSMGHGNYLMSQWTGNMHKQRGYEGKNEHDTRFEVVFLSGGKDYYPYKEYRHSANPQTEAHTPATMRINEAKDGVELRFTGNPSREAMLAMTNAGFRQNRFKTFWYAKRSEKTLQTARQLSSEPEALAPPDNTEAKAEQNAKEHIQPDMATTEKAQPESPSIPPPMDTAPAQQMLFA